MDGLQGKRAVRRPNQLVVVHGLMTRAAPLLYISQRGRWCWTPNRCLAITWYWLRVCSSWTVPTLRFLQIVFYWVTLYLIGYTAGDTLVRFGMKVEMMKIAFITFNSSLVPLIENLCTSNPWELEFSGFRRNQTDDHPSVVQRTPVWMLKITQGILISWRLETMLSPQFYN